MYLVINEFNTGDESTNIIVALCTTYESALAKMQEMIMDINENSMHFAGFRGEMNTSWDLTENEESFYLDDNYNAAFESIVIRQIEADGKNVLLTE